MCESPQQQASPGAEQAAAAPELIQRLVSELGLLLGDDEAEMDALLSPEVCPAVYLSACRGAEVR